MDTYDTSVEFKEFFKPVGEKHSSPLAKKIQDFKEKHPEADVSPQSLIALSTEQTELMKSSQKFSILCPVARPVIELGSGMFCISLFSWNSDWFNVISCFISFNLPFEAICNIFTQLLR